MGIYVIPSLVMAPFSSPPLKDTSPIFVKYQENVYFTEWANVEAGAAGEAGEAGDARAGIEGAEAAELEAKSAGAVRAAESKGEAR